MCVWPKPWHECENCHLSEASHNGCANLYLRSVYLVEWVGDCSHGF